MKILAVETSCDDTGIAIVNISNEGFSVLANLVSSQTEVHSPFGGVVPSLTKREHQKNIVPLLEQAIKQAGIAKHQTAKPKVSQTKQIEKILARETILLPKFLKFIKKYGALEIDAIALTQGPGLEPALWVGVNFARALSFYYKKPIIPVSHLEGHIFASLADKIRFRGFKLKIFPALALLVSGGHTQLIQIKKLGQYKLLGETLDDAAGEAFDKVAKLLGLPYPGGPEISKIAEHGNEKKYNFPRPMQAQPNFNFSFSGLKTSVLYALKEVDKPNHRQKADFAASFQQATIDVLVLKTIKAAQKIKAASILLSGGVAANNELKHQLRCAVEKKIENIKLYIPPNEYCTDNALMIALAGYLNRKKKTRWQKLEARANLNFK